MKRRARALAVGVASVALSAAISADTLVMRDGRRVQGDLVSIHDNRIEFDVFDRPGERERERERDDARPGRPAGLRERDITVGRVGGGSDIFFIGDDTGPIRMRSSGRLCLGVNDDYLRDNTGSFRVTVYY